MFHPRPRRVIKILEAEAARLGWTGAVVEESVRETGVFDTLGRHLLGGGQLLLGEADAARLHDADGAALWEGDLGPGWREGAQTLPPELRRHLGRRIDDWRLARVAELRLEQSRWRAVHPEHGEFGVGLTRALHRRGEHEVEAMLLTIAPGGGRLGRAVEDALLDSGGVCCPWPVMLLARKAAAAEGWVDPRRVWLQAAGWQDLLTPLIRMLKGVAAGDDPACVAEARADLARLRLLLGASRRLQGKQPKQELGAELKRLHDELGPLRSLDRLLQFLDGQVAPGQWVGVPRVFELCPDWRPAMAERLRTELQARRRAELERLLAGQPFLADPESLRPLAALWPRFPQLEEADGGARGRWMARLDKHVKKLAKEVAALPPSPGEADWAPLLQRCRKLDGILEWRAPWMSQPALDFLQRQVAVWYARLNEFETMRTGRAALAELAGGPAAREAALLAEGSALWLAQVGPLMRKTIPTLGLALHNARRRLD